MAVWQPQAFLVGSELAGRSGASHKWQDSRFGRTEGAPAGGEPGKASIKAVFSAREADRLTDATLLNLENSRVRGLALNLPQIAAGQPLPSVTVSRLPASISGFWGLFEIRLQAGTHQKTQLLRIPMVRRGYVSVFLSEEGKLFLPTARHIWDALVSAETNVVATLGRMNRLPPMRVCRKRPSRLDRSYLRPCSRRIWHQLHVRRNAGSFPLLPAERPLNGLGCRRYGNSGCPVATQRNPNGGMNCSRRNKSCRKFGHC